MSRTSPIHGTLGGVESATLHAVAWLVAGNAVGLLLATLLLAPGLGSILTPLTYGRWIPVHTNLLLYGWCGLALVALLFRIYSHTGGGRWPGAAVGVWSGSLLFAAVSWLAGRSSGKAFLEWTGSARVLLAVSLAFLAVALARSLVRETARSFPWAGVPGQRRRVVAKWVLLAALGGVPALMYWATGPEVRPPINPASGGPTGVSLMGSSLGVVAIVLLVPVAAGLHRRTAARAIVRPVILLAAHLAWFLALDHGDHSNREPIQIAAVASLLVWFPVLRRYLRGFAWPGAGRRWMVALGAWSAALLATAIPTFLPGVLERWKFTNALVGHAHLAMAGFVSTLLVVLLIALNRDTPLRAAFGAPIPFVLWHAGGVLNVASMLVLGALEGARPGLVFRGPPVVGALYALRWVAGAAMLLSSMLWAREGFRAVRVPATSAGEAGEEWHHAA
jgi:cytochrome c oxidase cbb3-type subunit 1